MDARFEDPAVVLVVALGIGFHGYSPGPSKGVPIPVFLRRMTFRLLASGLYFVLFVLTNPRTGHGALGYLGLLVFGWMGVLAVHNFNEYRRCRAEFVEKRGRLRDAAARRERDRQE